MYSKQPRQQARAIIKEPLSSACLACREAAHVLFGFSVERITVRQIESTLHEIQHNGCFYQALVHKSGGEYYIVFNSFPSTAKHTFVKLTFRHKTL